MQENTDQSFNKPENEITEQVNQSTESEVVSSDDTTEKVEEVNYEEKIAELNDKYLRLYSEFDNYRKRTIKEKSDIIRAGGEDVFKTIIPAIDDFERAIKANEFATDIEAIKEGVSLIYHKFVSSCTAKGLVAMDCVGQPFDADIMEAITHIPAPTEDLKGKVVDEVERGYKLGDKVIRFAKVVVGN